MTITETEAAAIEVERLRAILDRTRRDLASANQLIAALTVRAAPEPGAWVVLGHAEIASAWRARIEITWPTDRPEVLLRVTEREETRG